MNLSAIFLLLSIVKKFQAEEIIVKTGNGEVRGSVQQNIEAIDYYSFKGIPFAKPPIGELRFQDPQPVNAWSGVRNATEYGSSCTQINILTKAYQGSEDCLYLNVFTKSIDLDSRLPVMFWIHGGGFSAGDGSDSFYGPDYLLLKDIVLVTINYRLGVFGFFSMENELAAGNQGLKDQVMALKWVQANIAKFGGDPKRVTIFGESAGGASVHFLTLSPLTAGLFTGAIAQSGVALAPWNYQVETPTETASRLSRLLGNDTKEPIAVVEFLKSIDSKKLLDAQESLTTEFMRKQILIPFGPTIDLKSKNPFMTIDFETAAKKGVQVPLLIGYNSREAIPLLPILRKQLEKLNHNFEELLHPRILRSLTNYNRTSSDLKKLYFGNHKISERNIETLVDMAGDIYFVEPIHRVVRMQVDNKSTSTYLYKFTYDKDMSPLKKLLNETMTGASHMDELHYLFRENFFEQESISEPFKKGSSGYRLMERMIDMWVNFAKTGKPIILTSLDWEPVNESVHLRCLNINEENRMERVLNLEKYYSNH